MDIQFINITKEEFFSSKLLHKYMPLEYALKTLNNKQLWFANPITWKDPFEKRFIEAKFINNGKTTDFQWKNKVFCICMTQTATSEAYWNTYSNSQIGIEFRINKEKLFSELENIKKQYDIFIGKVEYMKTSDIKKVPLSNIPFSTPIPELNTPEWKARLLLLKRIAYKYEDEIRIILVKKSKTQENGINLNYNCKNTELIHSIILDPKLQDNTTEMLKDIFENKYNFKPTKNIKERIQRRVLKSQLYAEQKPQSLIVK